MRCSASSRGWLRPDGVLAMMITPLAGFFPNIMRRQLSFRITDPTLSFEEKTAHLISAFGSHLATIADMTRTPRDRVHDCMLNPHYFNVVISLNTVLDALGSEIEMLAAFPGFTLDWRWFKSLSGRQRRFNGITFSAYHDNLHNFVDYRKKWARRPASINARLDVDFIAIDRAAVAWQAALDGSTPLQRVIEVVSARLSDIVPAIVIDRDTGNALEDLKAVWNDPQQDAELVRNMRVFKELFAPEIVHIWLGRPHVAMSVPQSARRQSGEISNSSPQIPDLIQ